jgi:glycosyltransferase involved in cell wall biosynthesis
MGVPLHPLRIDGMRAAVIVSTYNSPRSLERVLWGYAGQTYQRFELIVADDGSSEETRKLIERFASQSMPVHHVWHPDDGFRKCTILNRAIASTEAEYLIFSDGDCIPRSDFVATHLTLREPGHFLSGGAVRLPPELSQHIQIDDVIAGRATDRRWLRANGLRRGLKVKLRLGRRPRVQHLWDRLTLTRPTLNGNNTSAWRCDIVDANGFDERMGYGGEDRELGERLENAGVRGKQIRHRAVCVHLHHERGYVSDHIWRHNDSIRQETRQLRRTVTSHGIYQMPDILPFPSVHKEAEVLPDYDRIRKAA